MEDLTALAFIQSLQNNRNHRFLTYTEIENFGSVLLEHLKEDNIEASLVLSRMDTEVMLNCYSDFFIEQKENRNLGIRLQEDKCVEDLINTFCGYLSSKVIKAFLTKK